MYMVPVNPNNTSILRPSFNDVRLTYLISELMDPVVAGRDLSAANQQINLAAGNPPLLPL
jgi:hypothetical protein